MGDVLVGHFYLDGLYSPAHRDCGMGYAIQDRTVSRADAGIGNHRDTSHLLWDRYDDHCPPHSCAISYDFDVFKEGEKRVFYIPDIFFIGLSVSDRMELF